MIVGASSKPNTATLWYTGVYTIQVGNDSLSKLDDWLTLTSHHFEQGLAWDIVYHSMGFVLNKF